MSLPLGWAAVTNALAGHEVEWVSLTFRLNLAGNPRE